MKSQLVEMVQFIREDDSSRHPADPGQRREEECRKSEINFSGGAKEGHNCETEEKANQAVGEV